MISQCLQAQCGVPTDPATVADCANQGMVGSLSCMDPQCAPFRGNIPGCNLPDMPQAVNAPLPTIVTPAADSSHFGITPESLMQKLPSIIDRTPVNMEPAECNFDQWVTDNPLLALAGLVGVAVLLREIAK